MSDAPDHANIHEPQGNEGLEIKKNEPVEQPEKKQKKKKEKKEEKPGSYGYNFKQQILRAWQPVPSFGATLAIFIAAGIFFLALGIAMLLLTKKIWRTTVQYDTKCTTIGAGCTITVPVDEYVEGPVFFYYEINNFYQNYRRFLNSKDINQLKGDIEDYSTAESYCNNAVSNAEMGKTKSYGGNNLGASDAANPCGLFARALFNDTYVMYDPSGTRVGISESGIAWDTDVNNVYKQPSGSSSIQWTDPTNEHFMVWMRAAFDPDFIKLWGRIEGDLSPGTYKVDIQNNFDVSPYGGAKKVFLATANAFGGSNSFLAIAYISVGGVSFFFAILSIINKHCIKSKFKRVMADD